MSYLDVGSNYINVDGNLVESDALNIAERIAEYDPNLYVVCLDPDQAGINDAPFLICEMCPDGNLRRVFEAWALNETVLERIEASDSCRHDAMAAIEYKNAKAKKEAKQRYEEKRLEIKELTTSILKSSKSTYKYKNEKGETVKFHYNKPVEVN